MEGLIFEVKFDKINISRHRGVSDYGGNMRRTIVIKMIIVTTFVLWVLLTSCSRKETELISLEETEVFSEDADVTEEQSDSIFVYVCGAVFREGVYELPIGSRVYEAIEKAGGVLENAAVTQINQAEVLEDEAQLYIPTLEEVAMQQAQEDGKVNLNSATKEELMTLTGVGATKAESILSYRQTNGKFKSVEDIMQISGIKEGLFNKIKDYITV